MIFKTKKHPHFFLRLEADFFWSYVIMQDVCNKFIEINFCLGCMVWPWLHLFQHWTFAKYWWDVYFVYRHLASLFSSLDWKSFQAGALFVRLTSLKMISDILYIRFWGKIIISMTFVVNKTCNRKLRTPKCSCLMIYWWCVSPENEQLNSRFKYFNIGLSIYTGGEVQYMRFAQKAPIAFISTLRYENYSGLIWVLIACSKRGNNVFSRRFFLENSPFMYG